MTKIRSLPYLQPKAERIRIEELHIVENNHSFDVPVRLPHWDPATDITFQTYVTIDLDGIRNDCRLHQKSSFGLVFRWTSGGTGLQALGSKTEMKSQGTIQKRLMMSVKGKKLNDNISIFLDFVLLDAYKQLNRVAPWMAGSRLWQHHQKMYLTGDGSRFPTDIINFKSVDNWLPDEAAWYLDWDRYDFHRPVLGSIRLYINSQHDLVAQAATANLEADGVIRQAIYFDVAKTMIQAALNSDEFIEDFDLYEENTVGIAIRRHLQWLFQDYVSVEDIQQEFVQNPDRFNSLLQSRMQLYWNL